MPTKTTQPQTHTIDASGKRIGRVACTAASILMGKHTTAFARNRTPEVRVVIINADQLAIGDRKRVGKTYTRYSGYPGGLKSQRLEEVVERRGAPEVVRRAVYGMLPKNRLRTPRMNRLTITP